MRLAAIVAVISLAFAGAAGASPHCATGVACGNTCIAKGKTCHVTPPRPVCKTGKLCGNTCIKATEICHKP